MVRGDDGRTCMQSDARHGKELCVEDITPLCEQAKQSKTRRRVRHNGHVSKFTKMNHFTDVEWNLRLRRTAVLVPRGHWKCKLARVCRCRIGWRRPENQRWDRKLLTEMNGEPWNTSPLQGEKLQIKRQGVHCPKTFDQGWRSERKHGVLRAWCIKSAGFESKNTGYCGQLSCADRQSAQVRTSHKETHRTV